MGHLENHHHTYQTVRPFLDAYQMARLIMKLQGSRLFEVSEFSHISLRGTDTCIGYLGDESAELVDENNPEMEEARKNLTRYFKSV